MRRLKNVSVFFVAFILFASFYQPQDFEATNNFRKAVNYLKTNEIPVSFETYLRIITHTMGWNEDKTSFVRQKVVELIFPKENDATQFLWNYKKNLSRN